MPPRPDPAQRHRDEIRRDAPVVVGRNDDGVCDRCQRGSHRLCIDADCTCVASATRFPHTNRPKERQGPRPLTAEPTPIRPTIATPPKQKQPPRFELKPVDALPNLKRNHPTIADRANEVLAANELVAGRWYELIHYETHNTGQALASLRRAFRGHPAAVYEFEARGNIIYVRLAEAS